MAIFFALLQLMYLSSTQMLAGFIIILYEIYK